MGKYKYEHHWNYRIVTRLSDRPINERLFSVTEVYYNRNNKPDSYIDSKNILNDIESKKAIKWTLKKIKKALKKEVLDLDNWPHAWKKK